MKNIKFEKMNFLNFIFIIFIFVVPLYMIIQQPSLIVDKQISKFSFIIVFLLAVVGMFIEKHLFYIKEKNFVNF